MIKYQSDCVSCELPCLGESCPHYSVAHLYCDECGDEVEECYNYDGEQLCKDCLVSQFEKVRLS